MNEEIKKEARNDVTLFLSNVEYSEEYSQDEIDEYEKEAERTMAKVDKYIDKVTLAERKRCAKIAIKQSNAKIEGKCIAEAILNQEDYE